MIGYCVKCKTKREMKDVKNKLTSRGTKMAQGLCSKCGCKMSVMVGNK